MFQGNGTQNVSRPGGIAFDYIQLNKGGGSVKLLSDASCDAPNGGDVLQFNGTVDFLDLNGQTFTINSGTVGGTNANGGFKGGTTSNLAVNGSGSSGTARFVTGGQDLNNLTINRTSGDLALGSDLTVNGTLTFTDGKVTTGSNVLTIAQSGSVVGASSTRYVFGNLKKKVVIGGGSGSQSWE